MQRKKGSKRIEIFIKMVNEFKLAVVHLFCMPKPDAALCMRVDLLLDEKSVENQDGVSGPLGHRRLWARLSWVIGHWTFGPPGCWAVAVRNPRSAFSKTLRFGME